MSKNLKTSVKLNTNDAVKSLDRLEKKIQRINNVVNKTNSRNSGLTKTINKINRDTQKVTNSTKQYSNAVSQVNRNYQKTSSTVGVLTKKVRALASAYLGVMGAKAAITTSDTITSAKNKLNYINNGDTSKTQTDLSKMYVSAQNSRMKYTSMIDNASKSMMLAGDAFQNNVDNAIRFQEIMAKSYTIGGASAAEQHSSMYQMIQALGSGILQGDELRSVREGAPLAYKEIEKFAQGVYDCEDSLKDMASAGMISSELVVAAIMNAGEKIDGIFENTEMTFAQAFTQIQNTAVMAFKPVLEMMNQALRSDAGTAIINGIGFALQVVAGAIRLVFLGVKAVYEFIVNHWSVIRPIVMALGTAIALYLVAQMWSFISSIAIALYNFGVFISQAIAMIIRFGVSATSVLLGVNLWFWIIIAVIAILIGIVYYLADSFVDACGIIVGSLFVAGALIYNIFVGAINAVIQALYSMFVEPIAGIIEWFVNAFNGGFTGVIGGAANAIGQIVSMFLGGLKIITQAVDAIAGTNFTAKVSGWQDSAKSWGKNDSAVNYKVQAPTLNRIAYGDAYDTGYKYGQSIGQWTSDKLNGLLNMGNIPSTTDSQYDVGNAYSPSAALDDIGDIADNTDKIADAVALSSEDLEYLRKIASMEWKKEFTTANITVDMKNYNQVNGDDDLDGIVTTLTRKLYEELGAVAEGVYV